MSEIRQDITGAHETIVSGLGRSGTWWSASERVAIAAAVRSARSETGTAPWTTPASLGIDVESDVLPESSVNTIWRLTNHPGTLTAEWYESIISLAPWDRAEAERRHVELVAVVAMMNAVDSFADALKIDLIELPTPDDSSPTRATVDAAVDAHWVPTTAASGPNVFRALSSVPASFAETRVISESHYVPNAAVTGDLTWDRGTLDRGQIELVAAVTSMQNECFY